MNDIRGHAVNQTAAPSNTNTTQSGGARRRTALRAFIPALCIGAMIALAQPAWAQGGCTQAEKNMQCTEFGTISMDSQRDIRGEPIDITATITLDTAFADQGARWLLFSVSNVTEESGEPITITLKGFSTYYGAIVTTRVEHHSANMLNLWVDTLDTPVGTPISLDLKVGATERGAYRLEVLVMAFDRGYAPVQDAYGNDASLFSFTLLGVNKETKGGSGGAGAGGFLDGNKVPGFGFIPALAALMVAGALLLRRSRA